MPAVNVIVMTEAQVWSLCEQAAAKAVKAVKPSAPTWVDLKGICEHLGISKTTLRKLLEKGLPFAVAGEQKRFCIADVDAFMRGAR